MNSDLQNTQTGMTVEEVRGSLDLTDNGAIRNSIRNCLTVFQNDPHLQGAIRYNILTEWIDIVKPLWWEKLTATLNDTDFNYFMLYLEDKYGLTSEKKIEKAISIVADCNKYHPIRDYLNSLKWDGTERIRYALTRYLGAEDSEYTYECLRLFMLGAIRRVFKPGCKFEVMLCLVGGQGAGKSTFFRLLAVRKPTKCRMKPIRQTDCGNACSAAVPIRWTSCPLTEAATEGFCPSWYTQSTPRFTFWKMKPHRGRIST